MRGKRGYGAQAIAEKVNTSMLSSPNDHKLSATSLQRAIESKRAGQSPSKLGRPERIPFQLVAALAKQSAMTQVASEGEASGKKIKALTEGLVTGTKWESVFSMEYCWKRTWSQHPEILIQFARRSMRIDKLNGYHTRTSTIRLRLPRSS